MDLVQSIIGMKQAENASRVQYAVAAKILQSHRDAGSAAVQLIQAATSGVSKAGDQLVAAATGLGGSIDTFG